MDIDTILEQREKILSECDGLEKELSKLRKEIKEESDKKLKKELKDSMKPLKEKRSSYYRDSRNLLEEYISGLIIVPGDKEMFEEMIGYKVEIVDLGLSNKGIIISEDARDHFSTRTSYGLKKLPSPKSLLENRIVGITNAQFSQSNWASAHSSSIGTERLYYGLPVREKSE